MFISNVGSAPSYIVITYPIVPDDDQLVDDAESEELPPEDELDSAAPLSSPRLTREKGYIGVENRPQEPAADQPA